jgi:hypothetical protein
MPVVSSRALGAAATGKFSTVFSEAAALYGGIVSVSYKTVPYNSGRNLTANDVIKKSTRACKCQWFPPER